MESTEVCVTPLQCLSDACTVVHGTCLCTNFLALYTCCSHYASAIARARTHANPTAVAQLMQLALPDTEPHVDSRVPVATCHMHPHTTLIQLHDPLALARAKGNEAALMPQRLILIVDLWHPGLTGEEKRKLSDAQ